MRIFVSPRFELDTDRHLVTERRLHAVPLEHNFDDANLGIRIFEDRMNGWFFDPASQLLQSGGDGDVAAVHIVTPLIEALEQRYQGKSTNNPSKKFFKDRAKILFDVCDPATDLLFKGLRCGFAHHGFLKDDSGSCNILIGNDPLMAPVVYCDSVLYVYAAQYVARIKKAFDEYYNLVQADSELQKKFRAIWEPDWQMSLRVPGGCGVKR